MKLKATSYVIVPIPLHQSKKRQRGFNQSELIAQALQKYLRQSAYISASICDALRRVHATQSQAETKSVKDRLSNVQNCFQLIENCKLKIENSSTIVLVDDVTTSGATLAEAARVLRQAGAKRVIAFTLAKA